MEEVLSASNTADTTLVTVEMLLARVVVVEVAHPTEISSHKHPTIPTDLPNLRSHCNVQGAQEGAFEYLSFHARQGALGQLSGN